ncbi:uncharacterized protein [Musca autumnalis]|uniref:uncharacterized protein n=1 Tax=Musca autumnalis TaxID=221902 RepID=UPI003CF5D83C
MEEQMQKLLEAITTMTVAMSERSQSAVPTTNVNVISSFEPFDPKVESFKNYKERIEIHFQLKKIFADKEMCAKLLLQYIGSSNYALLTSLAAPKIITSLTYEEIIGLFESHFCPKKNILVEQHKFLSEVQNEDQSITDFVTVLQKRATDCEFVCECQKSVADIFLRAQFIRGIRSSHIREQLLQNPTASFSEIVQKSTALEAAKLDNTAISHNTSTSSNVNQIQKAKPKNENFEQSRGRASSRSYKNRATKTKVNYRELGLDGLCLRCGKSNHIAKECKINKRKLKCFACGKIGHVKSVCIKEKMNQNKNENSANTLDNFETSGYGINKIFNVYNSSASNADAQKFYVAVLIDGETQQFEVDSGAGFTLIPKCDFDKLKIQSTLKSTNIAFRTYTGDVFKPLGVVDVEVQFNKKSSREQMYVVSSNHSALLGRVWIRHLGINLNDLDNTVSELDQDNATIFSSAIFKEFCEANGILQKFIAPGHPATNGLAERYVQILKHKLKAMENDSTPLWEKVQEILWRYRATPLARGDTPAKLYLNREIRTKLDVIRPSKPEKTSPPSLIVRQINIGDRVQVHWYERGKTIWKFGVITAKWGNLHYEVLLDTGYKLKRHINQIRRSDVPKPDRDNNPKHEPQKVRKPLHQEIWIETSINQPPEQTRPYTPPVQSQPTSSTTIRRSSRARKPPAYFSDHVRY